MNYVKLGGVVYTDPQKTDIKTAAVAMGGRGIVRPTPVPAGHTAT